MILLAIIGILLIWCMVKIIIKLFGITFAITGTVIKGFFKIMFWLAVIYVVIMALLM